MEPAEFLEACTAGNFDAVHAFATREVSRMPCAHNTARIKFVTQPINGVDHPTALQNVLARDADGNTALHLAARCVYGE